MAYANQFNKMIRASISSRSSRVEYDGIIPADRLIIDKLVVGRSTDFSRCIHGIINYKLIRHSLF